MVPSALRFTNWISRITSPSQAIIKTPFRHETRIYRLTSKCNTLYYGFVRTKRPKKITTVRLTPDADRLLSKLHSHFGASNGAVIELGIRALDFLTATPEMFDARVRAVEELRGILDGGKR